MVAVTGPSGSGKPTVLNLLGLLDDPDRGQVHLRGRPAPRAHTRAANHLLRHHLGYLFQNFALIDDATVRDNLAVALTYAPDRAAHGRRIAEALAHVGMAGSQRRRVYTLSGGEQQRVAMARLLLKPSEIVLADEPTGSLDADNRDAVLDLLRALNRDGRTVVIATHDDAVTRACSRHRRVVRISESPGKRHRRCLAMTRHPAPTTAALRLASHPCRPDCLPPRPD